MRELAPIATADQEELSVEIGWRTLCEAKREQEVPVALFVLCKTIVEDDGGALFLNATVVQRVQVGNVPTPNPPTPEPSTAEQLKKLMFDINLKGPLPGREVKPRRDAKLIGRPATSTQLCAQTFDVVSVPIDVRSTWHRFPFRILQGTVELELQSKWASLGQREDVLFCPTLCISDPNKYPNNVVRTTPMDQFDRSGTLALLLHKPTIEIVENVRWKKGKEEGTEDDLFTTFPAMRLIFWFHEPTSKAVFKVLGPLLLVVTLMWVNFHEYYGIFDIWDGCPGKDRDPEYLANGIGIAITAVFMIPLIRAETRNSHRGSFTSDDYVALAFLVGIGVANVRNCMIAFTGCVISSIVVVSAMGSLVAHRFECNKVRRNARKLLEVPEDPRKPLERVKPAALDFNDSEWVDAAEYQKKRRPQRDLTQEAKV